MTKTTKPDELKVEKAVPAAEAMPATAAPEAQDKPVNRSKGRLRRPLLIIGAIVIIAAAVYYGWHYWTVGRFVEETDDAYVQADSTTIAPQISGYLTQVLVKDNQPVKAGQPLARIDDRNYKVAVDQAAADVDAAKADVDAAQASITQQHAAIAEARATVDVDKANLTFEQQDSQRYITLAKGGTGTKQDAQQAIAKLATAQATLERDDAAVTSAQTQIDLLKAQLAKAKATLAHDQAVLDQAKLNLGYTTITSPVDGIVGNRTLRVGQYVQAGTQLMAVVPTSKVYIVGNFKETQLTYVRPGQPVEIEVDTFPGSVVKGRVDSIAPASGQIFALLPPDNATGNFTKVVQRIPVRIAIDPHDPLAGLLRPGMSVEPTIDTKKTMQAASRH